MTHAATSPGTKTYAKRPYKPGFACNYERRQGNLRAVFSPDLNPEIRAVLTFAKAAAAIVQRHGESTDWILG
jgi:hypothetical protein